MENGKKSHINLSKYSPQLGALAKRAYEQVALNIYIFNINIPKILGPDMKEYGPFKRGDMISEGVVPQEILNVLIHRGAVTKFTTIIERQVKNKVKKVHEAKPRANALQLSLDIYIRIFGGTHGI